MIIKEQEILTPRKLRLRGFVVLPQKPKDFSSALYSTTVLGGKTYYKRKDGQPIDVEQAPNLTQYEGHYKGGNVEGDIVLDGDTLRGSVGSVNSPLTFISGETFSIKSPIGGDGKITFTKDSSGNVTGFTFNVAGTKGTVKKVADSDDSTSQKPSSNNNSQPTTTPAPKPEPQKPIKTIDYQVRYPSTQNPTKPFNSRPCDEKTYDWGYGCKNNKIGQMNQIFFGDRYGDIYGDELINKLRNIGILKSNESKITEEIYNEVLKLGEEQGYVKLQEMIVKETVKNILKERLIKN
jgi:hypothetical protein